MAPGRFPQVPPALGDTSREATEKTRSPDSGRRVLDQKLHRIGPAPAVAAQMTGDMDRSPARLAEELAERCLGGPKGDGAQAGGIERICQCTAQMCAPDSFGV